MTLPLLSLYSPPKLVILGGNPTTIVSSVGNAITILDNTPLNAVLGTFSLDKGLNSGLWSISGGGDLLSPSTRLIISKSAGLSAVLKALGGISNANLGAHSLTINYLGETVNLNFVLSIQVNSSVVSPFAGLRSGLPWLSGCYSVGGVNSLRNLRKKGSPAVLRDIDLVRVFSNSGSFASNKWANWASKFGAGTTASAEWGLLKNDLVPAIAIALRAHSAGVPPAGSIVAQFPAKGTLPFNSYISTQYPVQWKSTITVRSDQLNIIRATWEASGDGANGGQLDHLWNEPLAGMRAKLVADGLSNVKVILCPWWESNGSNGDYFIPGVGAHEDTIQSSYSWIQNQGDVDLIKGAFRQYANVARTAFSGYPGGVYIHFCPLRSANIGGNLFNLDDVIDLAAFDIVGPDYYDTGDTTNGHAWSNLAAHNDDVRWNVQVARTSDGLCGLTPWINYVRAQLGTHPALTMSIGEWGCWSKLQLVKDKPPLTTSHEAINTLNAGGDDNPTYINNMFDFFLSNKDVFSSECYFNTDPYRHLLTAPGGGTRFPNASAAYLANMQSIAGVGDPR